MTIHLALVNGRMRDEISSDHVSSEHLAAFLDGRLTGSERERAVRHFASCGECRQELTELRDLLALPFEARSRRWIAVAGAAAAILAFVVVTQMVSDGSLGGSGRVRTEDGVRLPDGTQAIAVVSPNDRVAVSPTALSLSWRPAAAVAMYVVTILDSTGTQVWSHSSADTSVIVPISARLRPGRLYFWSVDARLADGTTAKTGPRTFTVR
jgi:hypothetical protein